MQKQNKLMLGDNLKSLKELPDNSVDSVVTDPPYGLSFMNKKWDYDVPTVEFWSEVYRVLKPGGHVLSFGGTRTYHRMVVNIEDAGFEIRDQIMWLYGSGFPKSHNIGKATGESEYEGWGTALKPANEPICVARKPISEKTIAENVMKWGTGAINIDGCRIEGGSRTVPVHSGDVKEDNTLFGLHPTIQHERVETTEGRFPANVILECICDEVIEGETISANENYKWSNTKSEDTNTFTGRGKYTPREDTIMIHTNPECPCKLLDEQTGYLKSGEVKPHHKKNKTANGYQGSCYGKFQNEDTTLKGYGDGGGASRFFYVAKVSKKERNLGLDGFKEKETKITNQSKKCGICNKWELAASGEQYICECENPNWNTPLQKNIHPTVKPVKLMSYLCRLITPPNGVVLDPFMGSGSTGIAAKLEGFNFIGMEMDEEYMKIAEGRINNYEEYRQFTK